MCLVKLDGVSVCVLARVGMDEEEAEGRVVQSEGVTTEWREGEVGWITGVTGEGKLRRGIHSKPFIPSPSL